MKIILIPLFKFIFAIILTIIGIIYTIIQFTSIFLWELNIKKTINSMPLKVDYMDLDIYPYNTIANYTYKSVIHAIWNIR